MPIITAPEARSKMMAPPPPNSPVFIVIATSTIAEHLNQDLLIRVDVPIADPYQELIHAAISPKVNQLNRTRSRTYMKGQRPHIVLGILNSKSL
jgi:hypothetical protein